MWTGPDRSNRFAAGVALAVAIAGCSGDIASPPPSRALMPLTVGSHWSYEWYDSVEFGTAFTPGVVPPGTEVTVPRDTLVGGIRWAIVDGASDLLDFGTGPEVLADEHDGLYEFLPSPGFGLPSSSLQMFPYPTRVGTLFGFHGEGSVSTLDTIVTVPAGAFHCIRYDIASGWSYSTMNETFFISPGTGVILRVFPATTARDATGTLTGMERLEFRLRSVTLGGA